MHPHNITLALAAARAADPQRAGTHSTATVPRHRHLRAVVVLGLTATAALAAIAPTGALAQPMHDAATPASARVDGAAAAGAQTRQDLRSPDARDAAAGRGTYNSPQVVVVKVPQPSPAAAPEPSSAGGIDWADAGMGAGSLLGLSLIGLGGALVVVHRRRAARGAPPVAGL
jgi:hypothetical protein